MLTIIRDKGPIARLVVDRAEKKNAITQAMWRALPGLVSDIERDPVIRVVIVTGKGGVFASGADIREFESVFASRDSAAQYMADIARAQAALLACAKPTIAMISGPCIGAGCGLALACDLRFAADNARFGITPAKLGMIYGLSDSRRLADVVGLPMAQDLLLSGRIIEADEAARVGLVNKRVPLEELEETTHTYARILAGNAPASLRGIKTIFSLIQKGETADTDTSRMLFLDTLEQPDFAEGLAAFLGRRTPQF